METTRAQKYFGRFETVETDQNRETMTALLKNFLSSKNLPRMNVEERKILIMIAKGCKQLTGAGRKKLKDIFKSTAFPVRREKFNQLMEELYADLSLQWEKYEHTMK